jgi:hypothetical protein
MADNPQVSVEIQDDSSPTLATSALQSTLNTQVGIVTETAPASDTAASGLNGRLQRIAQRLTSIFTTQTDGSQQSKIRGNTDGTLIGNVGDSLKVTSAAPSLPATFIVTATGISSGNNRSMISLVNTTGSTVVVRIREIWIKSVQITGVTGVVVNFELNRITNHSAGTLLTPVAFDLSDSLNASVSARTGSTISGVESLIKRWLWSSDEWGPGPQDNETNEHTAQNTVPHYEDSGLWKAITLRANQGIHIKQVVNTTAGTFDLEIVFTQE